MAKDQFGFGINQVKWGKRKESDYSNENSKKDWVYDGSINHKNPIIYDEAVEYLSKNIPYLKRQMDNTEYLDVMAYAATKTHGLDAWKEAIDSYIMHYDPMNRGDKNISVRDPEGNWMDVGSLHEWLDERLPWSKELSYEQAQNEMNSIRKKMLKDNV